MSNNGRTVFEILKPSGCQVRQNTLNSTKQIDTMRNFCVVYKPFVIFNDFNIAYLPKKKEKVHIFLNIQNGFNQLLLVLNCNCRLKTSNTHTYIITFCYKIPELKQEKLSVAILIATIALIIIAVESAPALR